jgi:hypothetical protein
MKKNFFCIEKYILLLVLTAILTSCGSDGKDGVSYLSFDWDLYVDTYTDDNPKVPSTISRNMDYLVAAGTYNYSYDCSDGSGHYWSYSGHYSISVNQGKPANGFTDGEDGKDKYYKMNLSGTGTSINVQKKGEFKLLYLSEMEISNKVGYQKFKIGDTDTLVFINGNAKLIVTRDLYKWEKK